MPAKKKSTKNYYEKIMKSDKDEESIPPFVVTPREEVKTEEKKQQEAEYEIESDLRQLCRAEGNKI